MEIPEHLAADILTRLPIKSVLRFRAVCKTWNSILPNPATDLFAVDPDVQILYKHHQNRTDEVFSLIPLNNLDHISPPQKLPRVNRTTDSIGYTKIAGCCNGIVLLQDGFGMCLWNPATGETKDLPEFKPFHDFDDFDEFDEFDGPDYNVGLCFDAKTGDFKVILVFFLTKAHEREFVYSLQSDSWKTVEARSPPSFCYDSRYDIAMNSSSGMCHWSYLLGESYKEAILSFDANNEIFKTTIVPYCREGICRYYNRDNHRGFFMLKDYVAMFVGKTEEAVKTYEIWAMLEVGVKESWIKVMNIGPTLPLLDNVLRFSTNRKVFLEVSGVSVRGSEETVAIFDTFTSQTSPILHNVYMPRFSLATNYKKSQVRLGAGQLH